MDITTTTKGHTHMSNTTIAASTTVNAETAAATAQFFNQMVQDLTALSVNGKQAHWHVRGPNFIGIHELLDDVVDHARAWSDEAAERVIALGLPVDGRVSAVAAGTKAPEMSAGFQQAPAVIAEVVAQIDATLAGVHAAIDELGDIDPVSQDIAIAIAQGLDKDRWFLAAHIAA